jgi:hypothetical protein
VVERLDGQARHQLRPRAYDGTAAHVALERHQVTPQLAAEYDGRMEQAAEAQGRRRKPRLVEQVEQAVEPAGTRRPPPGVLAGFLLAVEHQPRGREEDDRPGGQGGDLSGELVHAGAGGGGPVTEHGSDG